MKKLAETQVLFLNRHVIAVNKPASLVTQGLSPADPSIFLNTVAYLKGKMHKPGTPFLRVVHRLDKAVSGVIVFARSSKAMKRLQESFRERQVRKEYLAVVQGAFQESGGEIPGGSSYSAYWDKRRNSDRYDTGNNRRDQPDGKLQWRLINYPIDMTARGSEVCSLVAIRVETGRKHQIRRQLAGIGHPILGDTLYGSYKKFGGSRQHFSDEVRPIMLHASMLRMPNPLRPIPVKGGKVKKTRESSSPFLTFSCPPPREWNDVLEALEVPDLRNGTSSYFRFGQEYAEEVQDSLQTVQNENI